MARRECAAKYRWRFLPHALIYPFRIFKLGKFELQELTNDNYSEIKLHNIFHIEYKAIEYRTNKKEPTISFPIPILERQRGSH